MTLEEREEEVAQDCLNLILIDKDLKELAIRRAFIAGISFGMNRAREIVGQTFPKLAISISKGE